MALGRLVGDWRDGARRYHQAAGRTLSFERSASLVVRVTINKAFKSPLLFKDVYEFKEKARAPGERADFSWRSHGRLHDYFHAEQYVHIGVRNNSNRKLSSLTFCAHSIGGAMLQIGDGEMIEVKADQPIPLGDLQPRREIILHLLAGSFWGGYTPKDIKADCPSLGRMNSGRSPPTALATSVGACTSTESSASSCFCLAYQIRSAIISFIVLKPELRPRDVVIVVGMLLSGAEKQQPEDDSRPTLR